MADTLNRFAPRDAENKDGALFREFTVSLDTRAEGDTDDRLPVAISSEAPVERYDWWKDERYVEVLDHAPGSVDLTYARDGLPFCVDHSLRAQVGLLEDLTIGADRVIRGRLRKGNHPDAEWVYADMAAGIRKKVSIGYWPGETYDQTKNADGAPPTRRYKGWMLYEASSVSVPADYTVGVGRGAGGRAVIPEGGPVSEPISSQRKEHTMSVEHAPVSGTPAAPDTRVAELTVIARDAGMKEKLADWLTNGTSVSDARSEAFAALRASAPAAIAPSAPAVEVGKDRAEDKPFASFVDQLRSIRDAASGRVDPRLHGVMRAAPSGLGEQVGSDGGFLIAPQFAEEIFRVAFTGGEIMSRVREIPVSGNQYHIPAIDETSRASGSRWGGVRAYRAGENDTVTSTKPKFRRITLDVTKKIVALGYATEEQLEDAPATSTILQQAFGEEIRFVAEREVWEGNGVGEMLGIMNSAALVSQAKETSQTAATINATNIVKMWSRLLPAARANAVWLINQDAEPQLPLMTIGNWPVYVPPTGLSGTKYGTLYNRPVIAVEYASTVGTVGDLVLADLSYYAMGTKGGEKMARSIHVRFTQGEETFRTVFRCDGQPLLNSTITPFKGSNTQSAFVALDTRA